MQKDGSKPVEIGQRPYSPKLDLVYEEPEYYPEDDSLEILFQNAGKALYHKAIELSQCDDIIKFGPKEQEKLDGSVIWGECPTKFKKYWEVFDNLGMKRLIQKYVANIDTGTCKPVCYKTPHYGPHETQVMTRLVDGLQMNGLVEDDDGPWGH